MITIPVTNFGTHQVGAQDITMDLVNPISSPITLVTLDVVNP